MIFRLLESGLQHLGIVATFEHDFAEQSLGRFAAVAAQQNLLGELGTEYLGHLIAPAAGMLTVLVDVVSDFVEKQAMLQHTVDIPQVAFLQNELTTSRLLALELVVSANCQEAGGQVIRFGANLRRIDRQVEVVLLLLW